MNIERRTLPLNALRAFESFARLGTMAAAAQELGVTHSAISRQIAQLEHLLDTRLLTGPRNLRSVSPDGMTLARRTGEALDLIEDGLRALAPTPGIIDLSCLGTLAMRWLIPRLQDFQHRHPQLKVRLTTDDAPIARLSGPSDVAIRVGSLPADDSLTVTPLIPDAIGLVAAPQHAWLFDVPSLIPPGIPRLATRTRPDAWTDWCAAQGLGPPDDDVTWYEHFYFLLQAVTSGLGMTVAPEVLVRDDLAAGKLIAPHGFAPNGHIYHALTQPRATPEVTLFVDWLSRLAHN